MFGSGSTFEPRCIFKSGFQISSYSHAVAPAFISGATNDAIAERMKSLFGLNSRIVPNPAEPVQMFKPCHTVHGGLCQRDEITPLGDMGSKNIYRLFKQFELKEPLPPSQCYCYRLVGRVRMLWRILCVDFNCCLRKIVSGNQILVCGSNLEVPTLILIQKPSVFWIHAMLMAPPRNFRGAQFWNPKHESNMTVS